MLEVTGYAAAIAVGLVLGIIGAGGAILTVPIMVYLMGVSPVTATVYSLFIVGATTFIGSLTYLKKGLVNLRTSLTFAVPSLISIFITRKFILPAMPDVIYQNENFTLTKDHFVLFLFAIIMLLSSFSMIFGNVKQKNIDKPMERGDYVIMICYGVFVGFITGLVGAGGGFLIVPALVLLAKLPVKSAIGTSLIIISANSLSGFIGDLTENYIINWKMLLVFLVFAIIGIIAGSYLTKFISGKNLKKSFGWFVLIMGIYIITREIISLQK